MTPHEVIEKNVHDELVKRGFKEGLCLSVSRHAVDYYRQRSMFKKNVIADILAWSKNQAKEMSRTLTYYPEHIGRRVVVTV
ncbi:hypothetical protein [Pseudomonas veronii]|uniref:Uncharacterized protein n=1 Tax=Pseudomonas veronii TaxID=76761 RepID=A0A4V1DBZ5_PSEVE|nr:hypothetical protein [Pseudomonas veronii]QCG68336.2 hypothetical protein E4167_31310 [Pseudomonas veronii]